MLRSRIESYLSRHTIFKATRIRHASTKSRNTDPPGHGENIWVFTHFQTNQVVYSLNRVLNNAAALAQIPFNGKKTVPRALRKDLWLPLAKISFEPGAGSIGLSVFQKLREYRRLHELQWGDEIFLDKDGKPEPIKTRGRKIMNQKANSIADIAAVLKMIGTASGVRIGLKGGFRDANEEAEFINEEARKKTQHMEAHNGRSDEEIRKVKDRLSAQLTKKFGAEKGDADLTQVEVLWKDLTDAEFAESWSKNVVHDLLEVDKKSRVEAVPWTEPVDEGLDSGLDITENNELDESQEQKVAWESTPIEEQVSREIEQIESESLSTAGNEANAVSHQPKTKSDGETLSTKQQLALEKLERDRREEERLAAHVERQTKSRIEYLLTLGLSEGKVNEEIAIYREKLLREIAERKQNRAKKTIKAPAHPGAAKGNNAKPVPKSNALIKGIALKKKLHLQGRIENLATSMQIKEQKQRKYVEDQVQERARYLAELGRSEEEQKKGVAERREFLERDYAAMRQRQSHAAMEKQQLWTAELEALERRDV